MNTKYTIQIDYLHTVLCKYSKKAKSTKYLNQVYEQKVILTTLDVFTVMCYLGFLTL